MAIAEVMGLLFTMVIGFGSLYLSFRRDAVAWAIIACVLFTVGILVGGSIPFSIAADGTVLGTPGNVMLSGLNMIFASFSLLQSIRLGFVLYKSQKS